MHTVLLVALLVPAQAQEYQSPVRLQQAPQYYHADDGDPVTTTHECVHWANSQLRGRYGGGCYYLSQGRFLWVPSKPSSPTLGQVAQRVQYRGLRFKTYLQDARYPLTPQPMGGNAVLMGHDRDPLHLFDEFSAYTAGAAVSLQIGGDGREIAGACELGHYAATALRMMPASYRHREQLRQVWLSLARRTDALARQAHRRGRYAGVGGWHRILVSEINRIQAGQ